ncbi:MAG: hypothetical protein H7Y43_08760 [Akkermansiaceae bacterium]|nr:hypothetical protein [Verrucomicrobiales bacterium]
MNMTGGFSFLTRITQTTSMFNHFKKILGVYALMLFALSAGLAAESMDDQYFRIYGMVNDADELHASGKVNPALAKYQQARNELLTLKRDNPNWNTSVVTFRLNYLNEKITAITQPTMAPVASAVIAGSNAKSGTSSAPSDRVRLINAGAEPHRELRFQVVPGAVQTVTSTVRINMNIQAGTVPAQDIKMPAMLITLQATVKEVSPEGDFTFESVVKEASVADEPGMMPQVVDAMKASLSGIKGLSTRGTISNRGISKNVEVTMPPNADPQVRQSLEQMKEMMENLTTPLPVQAVGPGAKWEVKMPVKSQGMTINQTATYQLVAIDGDRMTVTSTITQSATNQKIQNPAMPGLKLDLTKMTGSGTGNVNFNLTQLMPVKSAVTLRTDMAMGMNLGAQRQTMGMKMDMDILMEAK